ncbi:ashwin-like [Sabethes cyaneus]|uniref:ashwin-like n=1 Tax=Sabethes cyaneus TaxID=53552 RepID=UPI00237E4BB4|nr:ashwin-like [Sabethes cyaneus]
MDILHPHMLSKQQLLAIFHQRHFTIPRLEELSRDELIDLYSKHLLPLPRRGSRATASDHSRPQSSADVEMKDASPSASRSNPSSRVRQRIVFSDSTDPHRTESVDNVSYGVKRIRLISSTSTSTSSSTSQPQTSNNSKRTLEVSPSQQLTNGGTNKPVQVPSKRQKITWP